MQDFLFGYSPITAIQALLGPEWLSLFRVLTWLGSGPGILLVIATALWLWGRQTAYALVAVATVGLGLCVLPRRLSSNGAGWATPRRKPPVERGRACSSWV